MRNPWIALPTEAPFVLENDASAVEVFNHTAPDPYRIDLTLLPEPFQGRTDAPVVLLGLNPGLQPGDSIVHAQPGFATRVRSSLRQTSSEFPFYSLHPDVLGPGREWWERRVACVLDLVPRDVIARQLLVIEYFPYHSARFGHQRLQLPSQAFAFFLLREAMRRNAVVVVMRSKRLWCAAVPELEGYPHRFELRSAQNPSISPRNCPDGFATIVKALTEERTTG